MRVCNFCLSPNNGYLNEWCPVLSVIALVINKLKLEKLGIIQLRLKIELKETKLIGLFAVFDAILTGRQSGQKLQCLYGNTMANNIFQN